MEHTPTPYTVLKMENGDISIVKFNAGGMSDICQMNTGLDAETNAAFIVLAVNSHDDLIMTLRNIMSEATDLESDLQSSMLRIGKLVHNALKKAEGAK